MIYDEKQHYIVKNPSPKNSLLKFLFALHEKILLCAVEKRPFFFFDLIFSFFGHRLLLDYKKITPI